ncbi:MAG: hypothetical protein RL434_1107 [Pseudomonadota bacterium]|jgi:hypothetical protein
MWIFTPKAFLSIVAHRGKPDHLLVRARLPGDIETVFPAAKVTRNPSADYLYRAEIERAEVASTLATLAASMDYDNVKGAVSDARRARMMGKVWATCLSEQHD